MTLFAGLVAGLLAVRADGFSAGLWALATVGIVLAHTSNNLLNDLADTDVGLDTDSYPRALYAPHPFLSGLVTRRQLLGALLAINLADLAIMLVLWAERGWPVLAFALAGPVPVVRLHGAAAAAEEARAGRAGRARHLGPADGRGHLLLRGRAPALAGLGRERAVRAAVHERAHGQAHRQDPVRRADRDPDAAGAARRAPRPGLHGRAAARLLRHDGARRARRRAAVAGPARRRGRPDAGQGARGVPGRPAGLAAGGLPGLAAVVRGDLLRPRVQGRRGAGRRASPSPPLLGSGLPL